MFHWTAPLVVGLIGLVVVTALAARGRLRAGPRTLAALWLGLAGLAAAVYFLRPPPPDKTPDPQPPARGGPAATRPIQVPEGEYVGSDACKECHTHNHATWHDSYHRTMTQVASEQTIIGDFSDVRLSGKDLDARLFRDGGKFMAELSFHNPDSKHTYPVVLATGWHHRQAYWLASAADPRLMILPWMYLRPEKRWIPRHSAYINPMCLQPKPELAVFQADFGRWSEVCIRCHTTQGRPRPGGDTDDPPLSGSEPSHVAEFGISCEACHGPGAAHVKARREKGDTRLTGRDVVDPARLPHDRGSEVCGQCHSVTFHKSPDATRRWLKDGYAFRPGDVLADDPIRFLVRGQWDLMPADRPKNTPDPASMGSFWSDGMTRATGREYNGLIDSPCFTRGKMGCTSCHQMHQAASDPRPRAEWADDQLKPGMHGNAACLQCHPKFNDAAQLTKHTHHPADSAGSTCYNCHMPFTSYGLLKAVRSHQVSSPDVAVSQATGRPNGCNQCHLDRPLGWTADRLAEWYGKAKPDLSAEDREVSAAARWALGGDAGQRSLMAWSLGWDDALKASGSHWQAPYLAQLLDDRYDAVRFIAHRSLKRLPGFAGFEYDFVGPPVERTAARDRALRAWADQPRGKEPFPPAVLIDGAGRLRADEFRRLWERRDDRPMSVNE